MKQDETIESMDKQIRDAGQKLIRARFKEIGAKIRLNKDAS